MITHTGYITGNNIEVKKDLTVRPVVNNEFGFAPPSFKVFKQNKDKLCVPLYYGLKKFGKCNHDRRSPPAPLTETLKFEGTLREETHQIEAFNKSVAIGSGVLSLPCGFGKTTVALAIACKLGYRTMIIVHKEFLANQWRERIQQFCPGATIGLVQQNVMNVECDFVIAMLQSLSQKDYNYECFQSVGTLIVDEAHHICARVFSQALFKLCPIHSFGLSATPIRKDGLTQVLHWFLGETIIAVERKEQKQVELFVSEYDHPFYRETPPCNRAGKVSLVEMISYLVNDQKRNEYIIKLVNRILKNSTTRQILVLSDRRLHCELLCEAIGTDLAGLYMGGMKAEDLDKSSKKRVIFGTFSQAHEGLDVPTLDTLILATPKSDIKQSVGRIMRETGKTKENNPKIWDILDRWSLLVPMFYKRRKVYKEGGFLMKGYEPDKDEEIDKRFKGKCLL